MDKPALREGDAVYRDGGAIFINDRIVSIKMVLNMEDTDLRDLHDSIVSLIDDGHQGRHLYQMLTIVNGELLLNEN